MRRKKLVLSRVVLAPKKSLTVRSTRKSLAQVQLELDQAKMIVRSSILLIDPHGVKSNQRDSKIIKKRCPKLSPLIYELFSIEYYPSSQVKPHTSESKRKASNNSDGKNCEFLTQNCSNYFKSLFFLT